MPNGNWSVRMIIISDANVLIDVLTAELIREMFQLPETFAVPDILFAEELADHHPELPDFGLQILEMAPEHIEQSARLRQRYARPSMNDLLALTLARNHRCPLLTGDRDLRAVADEHGVEVHGTLWLLERLLQQELIALNQLEQAYERMRADQRRLPWDEVERQLRRLKREL